jgi:DNA-binding transcriptional MerR regulator
MEKLYYSIGEVSDRVGHEPHVLRYWEQEFDVLSPRKNRAGRRVYTDDDIEIVERIRHLLKEEKYTIEGAKQALRRGEQATDPRAQIRDELIEMRSFLEALRASLSEKR